MTDLIKDIISKGGINTLLSLLPFLKIRKNALHYTISKLFPDIEVLKLLLTYREIDVNSKDDNGDTPLHVAAQVNNLEALKLLLSKNAVTTLRNDLGVTPLFVAVENKHVKFSNILVEEGLKYSGYLADSFKKYYQVCELVIKRSVKDLRLFFSEDKDVDIDFKALIGVESPLLLAVASGDFELVEFFLKAGADVNYRRDGSGMSALHAAVFYEKNNIVDLLLDYNADINCYLSEKSLITPLHYAMRNPGRISAKMLSSALVDFVDEDKPFTSALHMAVKANDVMKCELFIKSGANVNHVDENGNTPLLLAISNDCSDVMELLLVNKANPNIANNEGDTPLHVICDSLLEEIKPLESMKKLIHYGADIDARNNNGFTALHIAQGWLMYDVSKFLLEEVFNDDINCMDKYGRTLLADTGGYLDCKNYVYLLLQGADINISIVTDELDRFMPRQYLTDRVNFEPFNNLNCPVYAHFEKIKLLGYDINELLWYQFQLTPCSEHGFADSGIKIADFEIELKQLGTKTICSNPKKTLYDVLFMKQDQIMKFCCNEEFENLYKQDEDNFENSYPHYGWLLNLQYRRGHRRRSLVYSAVEVLEIASEFDHPYLWPPILRYLENRDLRLILKSENK